MGLLVSVWLGKYFTGLGAIFLWLGVMIVPTVAQTARLFTPDALSCALVVFAAWLILEQRQYWWGMSVAVLVVWVRPDYLLFSGILAVALWLTRKVSLAEAAAAVGLTLGSYLFIVHFSGNYGWPLLFRHSFLGYLLAPGEFVVNTDAVLRAYPRILIEAVKYQLLDSFLLGYYALGAFLLLTEVASEYHALLMTVLLFGAAHVMVFPSVEDRFFGPITVVVSMSFVATQLKRPTESRISSQAFSKFQSSP